jgi:hypothetical protein
VTALDQDFLTQAGAAAATRSTIARVPFSRIPAKRC